MSSLILLVTDLNNQKCTLLNYHFQNSMRLIASIFAWQRSTLAERKLATIVAKNLSCLVTIACFFPLLRLSLTHLALLNSLRSFLVSSDSNVFTSPSHFSLCFLFYFDILDIKKETLRSQLAWQRSTLAERKFDYHRR